MEADFGPICTLDRELAVLHGVDNIDQGIRQPAEPGVLQVSDQVGPPIDRVFDVSA